MSSHAQRLSSRRTMACAPADAETMVRDLFERACRDDTFDDLERRAAFNRKDAGRLRHWIRAAQAIATEEYRRRS